MGLLLDFLGLLRVGNLQPSLVALIEAVVLQGVHGDGRLQRVLEIDKAKEKLSARWSGLLDEADALEAREGTEDIWLSKHVRLTSLSLVSLGTPSTYRLFVLSDGMWNRATDELFWYICWGGGGGWYCE